MGASHSHPSDDSGATSDPALSYALQIVSVTPISPFSAFWQHALSSLSFSLTAGLDPEEVAEALDRAAKSMAANATTSGNLAAMCSVVCMALEQYALVQQHAADTVAASESHPPRRREGDDEDQKALAPPEPLHTLFERIYSPAHQAATGFAASFVPPAPSASGSRASRLSAAPSAWLLDLITLTRLFLQHIVSEVEYGAHKIELLSLRAPAAAQKASVSAVAPMAAPSVLPQFPTHTAPQSIQAAVASADSVPLHSDLSYRLVHALLTALTDIPLSDSNTELHVELSNLTLVLFSAQMYVPLAPQYQHASIFLVHALCGPFARADHDAAGSGSGVGRCADLVRKLLSNCLAPTRALAEQHSKHLAASRMASSHAPSVVLNSDRGASFGHATPAHETSMAVLSSPLSVSALGSPSSSELDPRLGNVSPIAPFPTALHSHAAPAHSHVGSSLTRRFQQLAGAGGRVAPPLLKRLGSRLYSLLLLPVTKIFKFFFPSADGSASASAAATLLHDPLSIRSNLLLLLLTHQNCRALQAAADGESDPEALPYRHRHAGKFDWRLWRDEHAEASTNGSSASATAAPFKPTLPAATAASSIRSGAPTVMLPSLAASSEALMSPSSGPLVALDDNPFARALALLRDDAWDADAAEEEEMMARTPSSILSVSLTPSPPPPTFGAPTLSFSLLYDLLCSSLPSEGASLLLYTLLQSNPRFREFILVKTDVDLMGLPIIRGLYALYASNSAVPTSPGVGAGSSAASSLSFTRNRVYMLLILLLMLTEDRSFVASAHTRLILKSAPWYLESHLVNISLASACMLVLLKVAHANSYAHAGARDSYVQTNALAILANLAHNACQHESDMHALAAAATTTIDGLHSSAGAGAVSRPSASHSGVRLHANVSLKLISLLAILAKKFAKIKERAARERATIAVQMRAEQIAAAAAAGSSAPAPTSAAASNGISALDASRINLAPPSALQVAHIAPTAPAPAAATTAAPAAPTAVADDDPSIELSAATQEDLATFTSLIRLLLEIIVSSLSLRSLDSNIYLLYTLVQSRSRALDPFGASAEFADLADPLLKLCERATEIIDRAQNAPMSATATGANTKDESAAAASGAPAAAVSAPPSDSTSSSPPPPLLSLSVEELMALLKSSSRQLKASMSPVLIAGAPSSGGAATGGTAGGWRSFSYEEQPNADEFFLPFLWELAWGATGGLLRGGASAGSASAAGAQIVIFQTGESERLEREAAALDARRESLEAHTQRVHDSLAACGLIDAAASAHDDADADGSVVGSGSMIDPEADAAEQERLASEMEQIFQEHALQKHIGGALTTPAPLVSPAAAATAQAAAVDAANAQLLRAHEPAAAAVAVTLPQHLSNARMTRGQE